MHNINLYCYTHQCWFIAALVWRKRQDERLCRDKRQLGKRQRWGKASLIVFLVFFYFMPLFFFLSPSRPRRLLHHLTLKAFSKSDTKSRFLSYPFVMMTLHWVPKASTRAPLLLLFLLHRHPSACFRKVLTLKKWSKSGFLVCAACGAF